MKKRIEIVNQRKSISLIDDIVYSQTIDNQGNSINLYMSMLIQNVNVERKIVMTESNDNEKYPIILCIPGGGFTHCERNRILPEVQFLAEEGFLIASIDYRLSSTANYPAQMEDIYSAIDFLKSHAEQYHIDANQIGVLGRSAGGCLSLMAGMNVKTCYAIKAACSMYGIADLPLWIQHEIYSHTFSNAVTAIDTLGGRFAGGTDETVLENAALASPINHINEGMAHLLILHGDNDPIVPLQQSEKLYEKIKEKKMENKVDFYIVANAGHGSKEFFQDKIKRIIIEYFKLHLKKEEGKSE